MDRVIVIGNGLAGSSAAIHCAMEGLRVTLVSPFSPERSQSVMAMGGIAASLNHKLDGDNAQIHFEDTMKGGAYLADPNAVRGMVNGATGIIEDLERYGALFSRTEEGKIDQRPFGGHSKKRAVFCGAQTGKQLMSALILKLRALEAERKIIQLYGYRMVRVALDDDGRCVGCVLLDTVTRHTLCLPCSRLILATGGLNGVYGNAVGSQINDAGAAASLFEQGVKLANLEFVQYHPTTVETPMKRMLISEAARGDGGRLFVMRDNKPWYFMEETYPERGNLMPRDVISREIYKVCNQMGLGVNSGNAVLLDIRHLGEDVINTRLDEVAFICRTYLRLDPVREPIPVYPGVHFFMGGVKVNEQHQSSVEGLYAAGECACQYHGANRLGANSMLGAVYGGKMAALQTSSASHSVSGSAPDICAAYEDSFSKEMNCLVKDDGRPNRSLRAGVYRAVNESLTIARDKNGLEKGINEVDSILLEIGQKGINALDAYQAWLTKNIALLAKAMLASALHRTESRGAHMRMDFPDTDASQKKTSVAAYNGEIHVSYENIPEER